MVEAYKSQNYPTVSQAVEELERISSVGFPIVAMSLVNYVRNVISVVCMGRLGGLELAGGSLAIGFTNISGYSILSGLAMGMEPLCSQAFGSHNKAVVSVILQKTIMVLLAASLPIGFLWFNLEYVMLKLHQDPDITHVASHYCRFAIPDLIINSLLHPLRIYFRSKGTTWPLLWSTVLAVVLDIPIIIILPFKLHLGVQGVAIATSITNLNTLLFLLGYMLYTHAKDGTPLAPSPFHYLQRYSSASLAEEWGTLLRLAIPSCLAVCLEWWWYEFMTLLAGYQHNPQITLATSAIVIQTTSLMYTLPTALSASVSTRVGNELGAGRPYKARLTAMIAIGLAIISSVFGILLTTIGREAWGSLFTKDEEVLKLTTAILPIIGLCEIANSPQTTGCGVLRGCARPSIGAGINFYSFYIIGTPVAVVAAFGLKQGYAGLCYGLLAAQVACVISILLVIYSTNWEKESEKAMNLVGCTSADCEKLLTCNEKGEVLQ